MRNLIRSRTTGHTSATLNLFRPCKSTTSATAMTQTNQPTWRKPNTHSPAPQVRRWTNESSQIWRRLRDTTTGTIKTVLTHESHIRQAPFPLTRNGRIPFRKSNDRSPEVSYGDTVHHKENNHIRILFQNVKGLSKTSTTDDYRYYSQAIHHLQVDICCLAETNKPWQLLHHRQDFLTGVRSSLGNNIKVEFTSPTYQIDQLAETDSFQAGGCHHNGLRQMGTQRVWRAYSRSIRSGQMGWCHNQRQTQQYGVCNHCIPYLPGSH